MPNQVNRTLKRGDTLFFLDAVWQNVITKEFTTVPAGALPPTEYVPFDLTGCELWFTAKYTTPDPDRASVMELTTEPLEGILVIVPAIQGGFSVTGPALATIGFPDAPVDLLFDIQLKDSTARIFTVEQGILTVTPDITRTVV